MIQASHLSKFYGSFVAIQDISFSIPKGQIVAFLGPNGAGKSTTMKILSGFLAASEGRASIAGFDVYGQRLEAARRLGDLPDDCQHGIERGHGVLKNHRDLATPNAAHFIAAQFQQVATIEHGGVG